MRLKELFKQVLKSINPSKYHHISEKRLSDSIKLLLSIFLILFVFTFIFSFSVLMNKAHDFSNDIQDVSNATINISIRSSEVINVFGSENIIIDSNASELGSANIVFSNDKYYYGLFGENNKSYNYSGYASDLSNNFLRTVFIIFISGFILLSGFFFLIFVFVFLLLNSLIAYIILKKRLRFRDVFVIGLHAIIFPIILLMLTIPFINLILLSLGIFIVVFVLGLIRSYTKMGKYSSSSSSNSYSKQNRNLKTNSNKNKSKNKSNNKKTSKMASNVDNDGYLQL